MGSFPNFAFVVVIGKTTFEGMDTLGDGPHLFESSKRQHPIPYDVMAMGLAQCRERFDRRQQEDQERNQKRCKLDDSREAAAFDLDMDWHAIFDQAEESEQKLIDLAALDEAEIVRMDPQSNLLTMSQAQTEMFTIPMDQRYLQQQPALPASRQKQQQKAHTIRQKGSPESKAKGLAVPRSMYVGANALTPSGRALIEQFFAGHAPTRADAEIGVVQVTLSATYVQDPNLDEYLQSVIFEMDFGRGAWRKLSRRKKIMDAPVYPDQSAAKSQADHTRFLFDGDAGLLDAMY